MEKYNVWESLTAPGVIVLRHADVQLSTEHWKLLHTFEAKDRREANQLFREMGCEP